MSRSDFTKRRTNGPPHHPVDVCRPSGGKVIHSSRKRALTAMNALRAHATHDTLPVAVYRCRFGSHFHLTSREPW